MHLTPSSQIGCPHCGGSDNNGTYCGALPNGKTTPGSQQKIETLPTHARTNLYAATKYPKGPSPCDPDECPMAARQECGFNPWCAEEREILYIDAMREH